MLFRLGGIINPSTELKHSGTNCLLWSYKYPDTPGIKRNGSTVNIYLPISEIILVGKLFPESVEFER
jgi:hypothetical protein